MSDPILEPAAVSPWHLQPRDQQAAAWFCGLALLALLAVAFSSVWLGHGIEIDQAPRRAAEFRVDLNRAAWTELAQLPGIGETLAQRIIDHRTRRGRFKHVAELREVPGIGPKTLAKIEPYLFLSDES